MKSAVLASSPEFTQFVLRFFRFLIVFAYFSSYSFSKPLFSKSSIKLLPLIVAISILDVLGLLALTYALSVGVVSLINPIAYSSPIITVLLAFFILKERPYFVNWIGIAAVILGAILISI
jgi:uncharacterized membrane protein